MGYPLSDFNKNSFLKLFSQALLSLKINRCKDALEIFRVVLHILQTKLIDGPKLIDGRHDLKENELCVWNTCVALLGERGGARERARARERACEYEGVFECVWSLCGQCVIIRQQLLGFNLVRVSSWLVNIFCRPCDSLSWPPPLETSSPT